MIAIDGKTVPSHGFPGASQVLQLRRTVTRQGKRSVEVVYLINIAQGTRHTARDVARAAELILTS